MAVVSGYPISQTEFLEGRKDIADGVTIAEQTVSGGGSPHDRELLDAAERYGVGSIALAWLIVDYSLLAAAESAGIQASDEEIQQQVAILSPVSADKKVEEQTKLAERTVLTQKFLLAELDRIVREELHRIPDAAEVTNLEMMYRIRWATATAAEVAITGDPAIDATPDQALAYLDSHWVWALAK